MPNLTPELALKLEKRSQNQAVWQNEPRTSFADATYFSSVASSAPSLGSGTNSNQFFNCLSTNPSRTQEQREAVLAEDDEEIRVQRLSPRRLEHWRRGGSRGDVDGYRNGIPSGVSPPLSRGDLQSAVAAVQQHQIQVGASASALASTRPATQTQSHLQLHHPPSKKGEKHTSESEIPTDAGESTSAEDALSGSASSSASAAWASVSTDRRPLFQEEIARADADENSGRPAGASAAPSRSSSRAAPKYYTPPGAARDAADDPGFHARPKPTAQLPFPQELGTSTADFEYPEEKAHRGSCMNRVNACDVSALCPGPGAFLSGNLGPAYR
mmetsp:Transcript_22764/g.57620  ORF Transcript_22764/g.57620 Transcript_22764/m.57620 type:complete len:328 (+) Transcript_22764:98-1081(+)|eukprot:CAMPEP_0178982222 /NCGR_PEP_ID=MMETSP0795-20121207/380_1 /TAXON_ID=88552 /ORGANISM="Amoebophrya sp., Strain Ameob2" /LENGTH=327 /DNA_ID=CAMNT_0020672851 /DNA_START=75 /DNA_END=1058 /DNA_ORIENTATION=+